jgi:hypothetical protein
MSRESTMDDGAGSVVVLMDAGRQGLRRPVVGGTRRVATGKLPVQGIPGPHARR